MIQIIGINNMDIFQRHYAKCSNQSPKVTYCVTPLKWYSLEDRTLGMESRSVVVRVWDQGESDTRVFWRVMDDSVSWFVLHKSMHVLRPTDLYTITTTKSRFYLLHVNIKNIAPWLFWSLDIPLWSAKQKPKCSLLLWFVLQLQKIPKCHLLATTGAVSIVWQSAQSGYPLGAMRSARQPGVGVIKTQWKRRVPNNCNSSYIWKATEFHAHTPQIRQMRLSGVACLQTSALDLRPAA